jgi:CDP-4-dehydro-6-deoxyglucose reductase, E1
MPDKIIRLHEPTFGSAEINAVTQQMISTQVTMGKRVRKFEDEISQHFKSDYSVMCNSGSSANLLAIAAICNPAWNRSLKPGDEVIVPALSWATTVWPIIQYGLIPVFVDCDLNTYNIDPQKLRQAITPRTRAIMIVHVYGNPCNMEEILSIAQEKDLYLIEDCCEAMGAGFHKQYVGTFGHIGTMSLYYSHHITCIEGGLCLIREPEVADLLRILRAHGWSREADDKQKYIDENPEIDPRFIFVNVGYNLRPTEVQAVMASVQLKKLNGFIASRRSAHECYRNVLQKYSSVLAFQEEQRGGFASWFGFGIRLTNNALFPVEDITAFLNKRGVETRPIIAGNLTRHPALKMYNYRVADNLNNSDHIMRRGFAIGCHQAITPDDCEYVAECIGEFLDG